MENRTKPSPSPLPLPRGEGERANASSRFGKCRLRSHASKLGAKAATNACTTERPCALGPSRRAEWFSLSLGERAGVRGKGLSWRLRLSFRPLAPVFIHRG